MKPLTRTARDAVPVGRSALPGAVPPEERGDLVVAGGAVEFGEEIVRTHLVVVAPPAPGLVVPDAVAADDTAGDVAPPTHRCGPGPARTAPAGRTVATAPVVGGCSARCGTPPWSP